MHKGDTPEVPGSHEQMTLHCRALNEEIEEYVPNGRTR